MIRRGLTEAQARILNLSENFDRKDLDILQEAHALAALEKAGVARDTVWSSRTVSELERLTAAFRPDVVHVHNTFPLISPSLYWAASRRG